MRVQIYDRVTSSELFIPESMNIDVLDYSKHAQLGYFDATLKITGTREDVFSAINWLNHEVSIYSEGLQWFGYINSTTVRVGAITYEVSLDTMYNKIAAVFTDENDVAVKTGFTGDSYSQTIYDEKELLLSIDNASSESVQSNIERILEETKFPKASFVTSGLSQETTEATVYCLGPLMKSYWVYYERDFGLIQNTNSTGGHKCGLRANGPMSFQNMDNTFLSDIDGELVNFSADDKVIISNTTLNNGIEIVDQGTSSGDDFITISGGNLTYSGSVLTNPSGNLDIFNKRDLIQIISGEANDGYYVVDSSSNDGTELTIQGTFPSDYTNTLEVYILKGSTIRMRVDSLVDEFDTSSTVTLMGNSIGQSFTPDHTFNVKFLAVDIKKIGDPGFGIRISLYSDSSDEPGSEIRGVDVSQGNISNGGSEILVTFPSLETVTSGTKYWLVVSSLGTSADDYYEITIDEDETFTGGNMLVGDNNGTWVSPTISADLTFKVIGGEETTTQLELMLDSVPGIRNVSVYDASGLITAPYRDGTFLAYEEIIELLNLGTSNNKRLLLDVKEGGDVIVLEEEDKIIVDFYIDTDSNVFDRYSQPEDDAFKIVGKWVGLTNFLPAGLDTSGVTSPTPVFIESVQYIPGTQQYNIQSKTEQGLFNQRG